MNKSISEAESFVASDGWLTKFKERHGIRILSVSGESLSCNIETAASFVNEFKRIMAENGFYQNKFITVMKPVWFTKAYTRNLMLQILKNRLLEEKL